MTKLDWIAVGVVALCALGGLRQGLIGTVLSLGGLVAGLDAGSRIGPLLLDNGTRSSYTPLAALAGALVAALVFGELGSALAARVRSGLGSLPVLGTLDSLGGAVTGAAWGIVVIWVAGAVALQVPGRTGLRKAVQRSDILSRLNEVAPPGEILGMLARIDPLPAITGPAPPTLPPDPRVLSEPAVRAAAGSIERVTADACGLGVEGSSWVAAPRLVVTAAHVVAGADGISVDGEPAAVWELDRRNDVAVLDVPKLTARPLPFAAPREGEPVAILGFPENGPFDARPGRLGPTETVLVNGELRPVTVFSGLVRPGNSGGPLIDAAGVVRGTVFASRVGSASGYGTPSTTIRSDLARAQHPVSTGGC